MFRRKTSTVCPSDVHEQLITLMKDLSRNKPELQRRLRKGVTVNASTDTGESTYKVTIRDGKELVEVV